MAVIEVVKYNGSPDVFVWKYPSEELGTWTQLIVNESQEAILFKGGQALDLFAAGRHTLETSNIPLLNKIINLPFGGRSPFAAEVWFINKVYSLDIKWGTASPIQLQDPKYKVFIPVRSFGQFGIQILDSRKFLIKLVGTLSSFDKENIVQYFRGLYLTKVKDAISSYLIKKQISILEINAYLEELSEFLNKKMNPVFEDYGIKLVNFFVNDINVPEDDAAVKKLKEALAKKAEMDIVGYSYTQQRSFDTLEGAAKNPSSGQAGLMGAGLGLGMGVGIGGAFGNQMGGLSEVINTKDMKICLSCNSQIDANSRFCPKCGKDTRAEAQKADKPDKSDSVKCSACGCEFPKKAKFCPDCGTPYNPCIYCGADMPKDAAKCPECGKDAPKICPKCGASNKPSTKFCIECGEPLVKKCAGCGCVIEGSPKFCPECGIKL
ncbi:MAG: SPFH domain-containing protein [Eubacteriaceae bacterium]